MATDNVRYRAYSAALNSHDVEGLFDVDEHYPDIVQTLSSLRATTLFITGWLIVPSIRLTVNETFHGMLVRELQKADSRIFILWNTNYNGTPYPKLKDIAKALHESVIRESGATADRLKIILSTNMEFDLPGTL